MTDQVRRDHDEAAPTESYEAPRVVEDCPLETMSLACTKNVGGCRAQGGPPVRRSS